MKKLAKFSAFAAAAFVTFFTGNAQAESDWFWKGPDQGYTSNPDNWTSQDSIAAMVFSKDAFNKTVIFDDSYQVGSDVYVGYHGGDSSSWQTTDEYSFIWKAASSADGIASAPSGLVVGGWDGSPICHLRIEGGTYTFGSGNNYGWTDRGIVIAQDNDSSFEFVSGTINCLNNFFLHSTGGDHRGNVIIGGGIEPARLIVDSHADTNLQGDNGWHGSLTLKTGGTLETSYIIWNGDLGTFTFDGGTLVKNGSVTNTYHENFGNDQAEVLCGKAENWNYSGSDRTILMTANGGTIKCDSPAKLQAKIVLADGVSSAVLTKTGTERLRLDFELVSGLGLNIQEGAAQIHHYHHPSSLKIGENGVLEVACNPGTITVVEPGVPFTYPNGANLKDLIVPVGSGFVDYSVTYTAGSGLVITTSDTPLDPVEPVVVTPTIGSATPSVSGQSVTISLTGVVIGTGSDGVAAEKYSVSYSLDGGGAVTVLENQTAASASFALSNLAAGSYTYSVYITNDKNVPSGSKTVEFTIEEPQPTHMHVWGEWVVYKPATETEAGESRRYCSADGCPVGYESQVIPATGGGDDPVAGTEYHWRGDAPVMTGEAKSGLWTEVSNWTDKDGNAVADYPHKAGDIAVFHGMAMGAYVEIQDTDSIELAELRFEEGNTLFYYGMNAHMAVARMTISSRAAFEFTSNDTTAGWQLDQEHAPFGVPADFTVGNRRDLLYGGNGCIPNALAHLKLSEFNVRGYLTIDESGKLTPMKPPAKVQNVGISNSDIVEESDVGVYTGEWGRYQGVGWEGWGSPDSVYTLMSGYLVALNWNVNIGRPNDSWQGTISTGGQPLYFWGQNSLTETQECGVRARLNVPEFRLPSNVTCVFNDDHAQDTVSCYRAIAGNIRLGGSMKISDSETRTMSCTMPATTYDIGWNSVLEVECEGALNADTTINVASYNKKGGVFGRINLAYDGVVKSLLIDGVAQAAGTFGSTSSTADHKNDAIFSGTGVLTVTGGSEDPEPVVVTPAIGSATPVVTGQSVTISLSDVVIGTGSDGTAAEKYDVYAQTGSDAATKVAEGETGTSASFALSNLAAGNYTYSVYITNDKSASSDPVSVQFVITGPQPTHEHQWGEWEIVKPATATTPGLKRRHCYASGCDYPDGIHEEVIPPTGDGMVAEVDGVKYSTVEEAFAALATANTKTVKLLCNATAKDPIVVPNSVGEFTLDMQGYTLEHVGLIVPKMQIPNGGTLRSLNDRPAWTMTSDAWLDIGNGDVRFEGNVGIEAYPSANSLDVNRCTFVCSDYVFSAFGGSKTLNLKNCTVIADELIPADNPGTVKVGGDWRGGGQYSLDPRDYLDTGDATFTWVVTYVASDPTTPYHVVNNKENQYPYVKDDFHFKDEADFLANAAAKINDTYYVRVVDAVKAASDGAVIEIVNNATAKSADFGTKNVTLSVTHGTLTLDYDRAGMVTSVSGDGKLALDFTPVNPSGSGELTLQSDFEGYWANPAYIVDDFMVGDIQRTGNKITYSLNINPDLAEARIGDVNYFKLQDALDAAVAGDTVVLLKDYTAVLMKLDKNITLDLGGHTVTRAHDVLWHVSATDTFTVTNGTIVAEGVWDTEKINVDAKITVDEPVFGVTNGCRLVIADVNFGDSVGHQPFSVVHVYNDVDTPAADRSSCVIDGGTWYAGGMMAAEVPSDVEIKDGTFVLRRWQNQRTSSNQPSRSEALPVFSGGKFSLDPRTAGTNDVLATGYVVQHVPSDFETPYHVVAQSELPAAAIQVGSYWYADQATAESAYVAKVNHEGGETFYTSLADATAAALDGDVVTLITDIDACVTTTYITNNITLDGDGHYVKVRVPYVDESGYVAENYTSELGIMLQVEVGADAVIQNIHLMGGGSSPIVSSGYEAIQNHGLAYLENVTVTRSNGGVRNGYSKDDYTPTYPANMYMYNCRIVRNCRYCAGGILNDWNSVLVMDRSSLSENRSLNSGGGGGACENRGTVYVNNCVVCNNASTEVGGAFNLYVGNFNGAFYMMNTTLAGNFTSDFPQTGGGIGIRGDWSKGRFYSVNSLMCNNYKYDDKESTAESSDMALVIKGSEARVSTAYPADVGLFYNVYGSFITNGFDVVTDPALSGTAPCLLYSDGNVVLTDATADSVFNAYYASPRVFEETKDTKISLDGAQLISKDDGSLNADLARYAPIKRVNNGDDTYTYGEAVLGTDGVYTYFDASGWKNGEIKMGYATVDSDEVTYGAEDELAHAATILPLGDLVAPTSDFMETNYYERIGGRSFGVAGASGWLEAPKVFYTVKLAGKVENGTVDGVDVYGKTYEEGTVITLTATPGFAREFLGWYEVDSDGNETLIEGSNKTIWELTVDEDYVLMPRFSDIMEYLTPEPSVHAKMADDTEDGPKLYPVAVTTKWMTDHYTNLEEDVSFINYLDHMVTTGGVDVAKVWLTEILEETDPVTGIKMWQDYVLGIEPGDPSGRIWINSPQYMSTGKNLIRMEMNKLTPVKGTKFTINYRLDKKLGAATDFSRADVNTTGSYDVNVTTDPSGLYVIDLLFIPEGKATSEEYVTTVNTAGVLRVSNTAGRAAIAVPWTKLQPTGSASVSALDLVKTTNLNPDDIVYVYDMANKDYRAWKMIDNGSWSPLNVFKIDEYGQVNWANALAAAEGSAVARGLGIWIERANTNDFIYLCGQYDAGSVTTPVSAGWNLVGNPSGAAFELSTIVPTSEDDRIVIPTAEAPLNITRSEGEWGYYKTTVTVWNGREFIKPVWTANITVPAGTAFWYISTGPGEINWTGSEEKEDQE